MHVTVYLCVYPTKKTEAFIEYNIEYFTNQKIRVCMYLIVRIYIICM